mmetsp:Transcript_6425/g.40139  ORF Transcript_6425/g.40139 Transcript_6425/m.40139 type:complete len:136 (+) Transcript_6425:2771-3178(+)
MNDVVGQLQEEVNHLCALMYNYTGSLQRDAPPASLGDEPAGSGPVPNYDVPKETRGMAKAVVQASKTIDEIIRTLPPIDSEEEQVQRILELQVRVAYALCCSGLVPLADVSLGTDESCVVRRKPRRRPNSSLLQK